jgi:WD40 repeat protein
MYDAASGRRLRTLGGRDVTQVQWGYGGRPLVGRTAGADLWDPAGRRIVGRLRGAGVTRMIADARGRRAIVVMRGHLRLWDLRTGRVTTVRIGRVLDAAMSRNGQRIVAAGSGDGRIVNAITGKPGPVLPAAHGTEVRISPDGSTAATITDGHSAIVWDARTGLQLEKLSGQFISAPSLTFTPASDVVTGGLDGTVRVWRAGSAATTARLDDTNGYRPAFDRSGRRLATAGGYLWNLRTGREKAVYLFAGWSVDFSPGGDRLAVTGDERRAALYGTVSTDRIAALGPSGRGPRAYSARYSPDGGLIATGESDGTVRLWSASTLAAVRTLGRRLRHAAIYDAAFSRDGRLVAAGGERGVLSVYATATGRELHAFRVPGPASGPYAERPWINGVAVQPHGDLVAAASDDGLAHVWNMRTGLRQDLPSDDAVESVDFSPDGRLLVTASYDGTARLWDAVTGRQLAVLVKTENVIDAAVFSPDGRRIAVAPEQEPVRVVACTVCGSTGALIKTARSLVTRRFTAGERATLLRGRAG